jgi:hypothetical protein
MHKRSPWALRAAFLLLVVPLPFVQTCFGFDWIDTFYHIRHFMGTPSNMGFMVFLYPHLGRLWGEVAGFDLLSFRMLDALLLVLMHAGLPFVLCREASERSRLLMAAAGIVMSSAIAFNILGYDSFSALGVAGVAWVAWRHLVSGGVFTAAMLGILTALLTALRLPGLSMALPVGLLLLSTVPFQGRSVRAAALHVGVFAATLLAAYVVLFQTFALAGVPGARAEGLSGMVRHIRSSLSEESSANHPLKLTLLRYLRDAVRIGVNVAALSVLAALWYVLRGLVSRKGLWDAAVLVVFGLGLVAWVRPAGGWSFPLHLQLSAWGYLTGAGAVWLSWRHRRYLWMQLSLFLLCASFVPMAGSNTGLIKTALLLTGATPLFFHFCVRLLPASVGRFMGAAAVVALAFCVYYKLAVGPVLMDGRLPELTATVDHPRLAGVRTTPARKAGIEDLLAAVERVRSLSEDGTVLYYGTESYVFRYLDAAPAEFRSNHTMFYHDPADVARFARWVEARVRRPVVVLVFGVPEDVRGLDGRGVAEALLRRGYAPAHTGGFYRVYVPAGGRRP